MIARLLLFIPLLCLAAPLARAETPVARTPEAEVRLTAATADFAPGGTIDLGVVFRLAPGWHIYARNPGDAGLPTEVSWRLPPDAAVGELVYPPHRAFDEGGLTTFGYAGEVLFAARATTPQDAATLPVSAWLACNAICIPGAADLSLTLPATIGTPPRPSADAARFAAPTEPPPAATPGIGLAAALGLALLGGLLLNLMPCVLPILALKALHVAGLANEDRAAARRDGLLYLAGTLSGFAALGGLLAGLTASGAALGWGYQLQSPVVVAVLALLMLLIGLDLSGILPMGGLPPSLTARLPAARGPFATGLLAVAVASPCTAPFMGAAIGFAALQTPPVAFAVILTVGAGFALPFAALGFVPAAARLLPRPGPWMIRLRKVLSLPMFAAALWLGFVLAQQIAPAAPAGNAYSESRLAALRAQGKPVFVDFTADWCITCQINKRTALASSAVAAAFAEKGVERLTADWTRRDPAITEALARLGRNGVPAYALYLPGEHAPRLLPELLTPGLVLEALEK
jgi:thiol:disulfide interchange protein DsbD